MDLTNVFTDRCEVILYKGEWIYPIFKCGWAGFQYAKEESKYDEDIRELENEGKVEGAKHIPRGMLEFWLDPESAYFKEGKLDLNKEMVLFCAGGLRSALAAKSLKDMGFEKVSHIDGGFGAIRQSQFKII